MRVHYTLRCLTLLFIVFVAGKSEIQAQDYAWARRIGGVSSDESYGVAVDVTGNVYTTGIFQGTADFDPGAGIFNLTSVGDYDIFVSKLDASGNLVWAKRMGGLGADYGADLTVDASGNVYTIGWFAGVVDFDPNATTVNLSSAGLADAFVSKLDASGNLVWAKSMGGTGEDGANDVTVDAVGNVYTLGYFNDAVDFDPNTGIFNLTSAGEADVFVSKLDASGSLVWAKRMGSTSNDYGSIITLDALGNVYSTGYFQGTADFDPNAGTFNLISAGDRDIFVSKLDALGNLTWAKGMGSTGFDNGLGIAVDASGNVYTTGHFEGTADFDPSTGVFNLTSAGINDIFLSKLDASGNLVWAKRMGGTLNDYGFGVAVDGLGNVYITGIFQGTVDFDPNVGIVNLISAGNNDIFVTRLEGSGSLVWARKTGSTGGDAGTAIAIDVSGNIYTTGWFEGTVDFDPNAGTVNLSSAGVTDIYVSKLSQAATLPVSLLAFKGDRKGKSESIILSWQTTSENNSVGFEIEMSEQGVTYRKISFVPAAGNSNTVNSYQVVVANPDKSYYRLKQLNLDGSFSYSHTVLVDGLSSRVTVFPNPNNGNFIISAGKDKPDFPAILFDAQGRIVWRGVDMKVEMKNLTSGIYFLQTTVTGKRQMTRIVIER